MKKSLVALAALAATASFAQSNVVMYGVVEAGVDVGYKETSTTNTHNALGAITAKTVTEKKPGFRVQDGNSQGQGTSRIGWRGTEDLGGGLSANFQLEMGLRLDDGCATSNAGSCANSGDSGGQLFGRNAWGGLKSGLGEVRLGRQVLGSFATQSNGWVGSASNGLYEPGATTGPTMGGVRFADAVKYISPSFSGFTLSASVAAPEAKSATTTGATATVVSTTPNTGFDLSADYAAGPLYVGFGYNKRGGDTNTAVAGVTTASGNTDTKQWTLSASYNLGMVKPFFNYTSTDVDGATFATPAIAGSTSTETKAWSLGVQAPVSSTITVLASYANGDTDGVTRLNGLSTGTTIGEQKAYQIGMRYALSKRTTLQANYGQYKLDNSSRTAAGVTATSASGKTSGMNVGLRHAF